LHEPPMNLRVNYKINKLFGITDQESESSASCSLSVKILGMYIERDDYGMQEGQHFQERSQ